MLLMTEQHGDNVTKSDLLFSSNFAFTISKPF